jgi:hypothetical protein
MTRECKKYSLEGQSVNTLHRLGKISGTFHLPRSEGMNEDDRMLQSLESSPASE